MSSIFRNLEFLEEDRYKYIEFEVLKENEIYLWMNNSVLLQGTFEKVDYFSNYWSKLKNILKGDENEIELIQNILKQN